MVTENEALYTRLRNHPAVIKLINDCGASGGHDYFLIMKDIEKIDAFMKEGRDYEDVFTTITYNDESASNYAFLLHVEGAFKTDITSPNQIQIFTKIDASYMDDINNSYNMALECKYGLILEKILHDGGKYKDLENTDPKQYGLPETWRSNNKKMNKEKMIRKAIFFFIEWHKVEGIDPIDSQPFRLEDLAREIDAPLNLVREASTYYK